MYAKIFEQIYNSSIAEDYLVRLVFEDFLVLADINGVVDITTEAFARRTNVPIDVVKRAIAILEAPDKAGRGQESEGRRIIRLDENREWGWMIVKYDYYRKIGSEEQRREKTAQRVRKHREKVKCNASVTVDNALPYTSTSIVTSASKDKRNKELATYGIIATTLAEIVQTNKNVVISPAQVKSWLPHLRLLETVNKVSKERMTSALIFYAEHVGEEYMTVIESGKSFRQKFTKLEDAMKRLDYKPPLPAETDDTILRYAKEFNGIGGFSAELEDVDRIRVVVEDNCGGSKGWTRVIKAAKQLKKEGK